MACIFLISLNMDGPWGQVWYMKCQRQTKTLWSHLYVDSETKPKSQKKRSDLRLAEGEGQRNWVKVVIRYKAPIYKITSKRHVMSNTFTRVQNAGWYIYKSPRKWILKIVIIRKKPGNYEVMDVQTYCSNHFTLYMYTYVCQVTMLYTLNFNSVTCQLHLNKTGLKINKYFRVILEAV